jgi:hypothetical protein
MAILDVARGKRAGNFDLLGLPDVVAFFRGGEADDGTYSPVSIL